MKRSASACGKIILTGEYAVVFGYPGIALPSPLQISVEFSDGDDGVSWNAPPGWNEYARDILHHTGLTGTLTVTSDIPLGKGMGASTALVIAICRAVLGPNCYEQALAIETIVNPGHSGIDFAVIWEERPLLYRKGERPEAVDLPSDLLAHATFIDSGTPNETTAELVAWVRERQPELREPLAMIGNCTHRLLEGERLTTVIRDHHRAQCALGVVTEETKSLITKIEQEGGSAKVIGAGGRSGGSGMVLVLPAP